MRIDMVLRKRTVLVTVEDLQEREAAQAAEFVSSYVCDALFTETMRIRFPGFVPGLREEENEEEDGTWTRQLKLNRSCHSCCRARPS